MKMKFESEKWLEEFVGSRSEGAFLNIVSENSGLVFATAMRKVITFVTEILGHPMMIRSGRGYWLGGKVGVSSLLY